MSYTDNCERSEEMRGLWAGGEYQIRICYTPCTIAELLFGTAKVGCRYTRNWALFENKGSISWDEMNMFWIDKRVLIPDMRCCTGYWSTVVMYCAYGQQQLRIGMYVKIHKAILHVYTTSRYNVTIVALPYNDMFSILRFPHCTTSDGGKNPISSKEDWRFLRIGTAQCTVFWPAASAKFWDVSWHFETIIRYNLTKLFVIQQW